MGPGPVNFRRLISSFRFCHTYILLGLTTIDKFFKNDNIGFEILGPKFLNFNLAEDFILLGK